MPNRSPAVVHGSSLRQAYTLTEQGNFAEGLQVLDQYLQEAPQDKRAWVFRAHVMLTMGNPEGALDSIERVTHIDPADPMPWVIQGTALSTMGDYAAALHSLENALVADPENRDAHELRRAVMDRIQRQETELTQQQAWYELAELQYRLGRHDEALPNLERSLRQAPSDPAGWGLKACVLWALGRQEEAVKDIGRSIKLRGEDDWAYGVRGTMLKDLGRFEDALEDIDVALHINPQRDDLVMLRRSIMGERQRIPVRNVPEPPSGRLPPQPGPVSLVDESRGLRRTDSADLKSRLRAAPAAAAPAAPKAAELPLEDITTSSRRSGVQNYDIEQLRRAMEEAHHCYARNDYRAAAALYEKIAHQAASRDKHTAALAWLYRGRCHFALHEYEQSLTCYEAVARLAPENPSWLEHGLTLRHLGRYQEAMEWFDRCIEAGQTLDTAWVQKGHCALHLKQHEEATLCYQHATEHNPHNAHAWLSLAQCRAVEGNLQEAYEAVTRGLVVEPRNASGLELMGDVLCLIGRLTEARTSYEKSVELEPKRERSTANLAALRDNPRAVPEGVRKRYARPKGVKAPREAADPLAGVRALLAEWKVEEAWNVLDGLVARGPATAPALALKATLLGEMGRWEDALAAAQQATKLDPRGFEGYYEQARALVSLGRRPHAGPMLEAALQVRPRDGRAWALRGVLAAGDNDRDTMARCFDTARSYAQGDAEVVIRQAMAYEMLNAPEQALALYQQALRQAPRHPDALAGMGVTLAALGRRPEAWQAVEEALRINPYQATALEWSARLRHVASGRPSTGRLPAPVPSGEFPTLSAMQGNAEVRTGSRPDSSTSTWRRGEKLDGLSTFELLNRARETYERGDFDYALDLYDRVLAMDRKLSGAWFGQGLCQTALWLFDEGLLSLDQSSRLPDAPAEQIAHARKRLDAMRLFHEQSIKPLLAREQRAWRIFTAPSGAFRMPYPSWCQSFPPSAPGEMACIADRVEKPTFQFTVTAQPFVDPRELTMVKHGEQVVQEGEITHPQAAVDVKEVRDRNKGSFSLRAVLINGHMAWYLVGTARFHYYAGYRPLFHMMVEDFHLA